MLSFHAHLKVFVATAPCDLRLSFNGLWAVAQTQLGEDPKQGALFGTFHWPQSAGAPNAKLRLAPQALQLLLDGVDLKAGARRAWYETEN